MLWPLLVQVGDALPEAEDPWRKFVLVQEPIRRTLDEPRQSLPQLAQLLFDYREGRPLRVGVGLEATPILLGQPLGIGEPGSHFPPDRDVEEIRPHLGILTDALAPKAIHIGPQAPIIGIGARLALARAGTEPCPVVGIATLPALHQAWQKIEGPALGLPRMALILLIAQ